MERTNSLLDESIYVGLPPFIKEITNEYKGRERDMILLSTLGVLSNCFPNFTFEYNSNINSTHLYIAILAPAASGKGIINQPRKLIQPIHDYVMKKEQVIENAFIVDDNELAGKEKEKSMEKNNRPNEIKILPGNISSADMHFYFKNSKHGMIIIESEADTIGVMLKNDWSNYSDVLRKVFHNETISISRSTDNRFFEINNPKLSIVISGTPNQLKPVVNSVENGLFSRFIYYSFNELQVFKDVFEKKSSIIDKILIDKGNHLLEVYKYLCNTEIKFKLTKNQESIFLEYFKNNTDLLNENSTELIASLKRLGLILNRILAILSISRKIHLLKTHEITEIICEDLDFEIGLELIRALYSHTVNVYYNLSNSSSLFSKKDQELYNLLSVNFTYKEAVENGIQLGFKERTVIDKLNQWSNKGFVKRVSKGNYQKITL
ncbi:DUF3987 domain-containing protein [Empedobacter sp. ULE_I140]